ncbi:MAG: DNA polymerase III subunit delta [Tissierellaceae bacterium]|nr:DNA polymerase III subunit delta [Tissierellaceae bacterium]
MNYNEFLRAIKNNELQTCYLLTGSEVYLRDRGLEVLKKTYIQESLEELNYIIIEGKELNFKDIFNACETLPFMAEKKVVLIKDIVEAMESDPKDLDEKLGSYIESLGDYVCLVIIDKFNSLKKTTKLYKSIKKQGGIVEFSKLKGKDLNSWVEKEFKGHGKSISYSNISYFIQQSAYGDYNSTKSLYDLENEISKVINYAGEGEITKGHVEIAMIRTLDTNIFNLLDSINRKDRDSALGILNDLYISNEPIQRILFMIIRQIRLLLGYKLYRERGDDGGSIQKKLQIKDYEFKKISFEANKFHKDNLIGALEHILDLDIKQKTSSNDEKLALEMLIIQLSYLL